VRAIRRPLGLTEPFIEVFSNDPRLADLPRLETDEATVPA